MSPCFQGSDCGFSVVGMRSADDYHIDLFAADHLGHICVGFYLIPGSIVLGFLLASATHSGEFGFLQINQGPDMHVRYLAHSNNGSFQLFCHGSGL